MEEKTRSFQQAGESGVASRLYQLILEQTLPIRNEIESECEVTELLCEAVSGWLESVRELKIDSAERARALEGLFLVIQADAAAGLPCTPLVVVGSGNAGPRWLES